MQQIYNKTNDMLFKEFDVSIDGLTTDSVKVMREKYGSNELVEKNKKSFLHIFLEQFKDMLIIILLIAGSISLFLGDIESALVIFIVLILNASLGTIQHIKAEKSLNSLKALSSPLTKVIRDGEKIEVDSRNVVVGDIVFLEAGDFVPADGKIIENFSLQVNESSLTGESLSIIKTSDVIDGDNISIGDRKNMVFSGSLVTYGRATVLVTQVGMDTEIGKIAQLLNDTSEKKTPLQVNLDNFGKKLGMIIILICAVVFMLSMYRGELLIDAFMFAVALAVAAIPEALSSIVTIVLSIGTQRMVKENAIIRKLQAVEGLGSVSIICSDKTGTLTQNKMTVKKVYIDNNVIDTENIDINDNLNMSLVRMSLLCSDAVTRNDKEIGDPTEIALVNFGALYNLDEEELRGKYKRLSEIPFDSDRKLMSVVHNIYSNNIMMTKGAVDVLLKRVTKIETSDGIRRITEDDICNIEKINEEFSKTGLRVLAFAYKILNDNINITVENEDDFIFLGLISMMDPPREESKKAVYDCIKAGIKPVMITGDHKITAMAIAKQIGILNDDDRAIEGKELDNLTDEELLDEVKKISVYARVSPEHKIRIVRAWQKNNNVVAMTGDGVNDAPALKQADIGVAMGITGSEVAKDSASMILTDDNFATIVKSISNGRKIYNNIKNAIKFLLSGNTAGIFSVLYASILALPVPFAAVHLLFINLLTDSLPAIALGVENNDKDVLNEKPRKADESILTKDFVLSILFEGTIITIATMVAFHIGLYYGDHSLASTMAFSTLCLSRLIHGFNSKSKKHILSKELFSNKFLWGAFILGFLFLHLVLMLPSLQGLFEVSPLIIEYLPVVYIASISTFVVIQLSKVVKGFFTK